MERQPLGDQELDVLRWVSERAPINAREIAEGYGEPRKLAKTTVLTVLERLRKKGYLSRRRREGIFYYSPQVPQTEVLQDAVRRFVERTLAGSVSPVVAYLAHGKRISPAELAELERLVEELRIQQSSADDQQPGEAPLQHRSADRRKEER